MTIMTDSERLILFHQIFPRIGLTIGELMEAEVLYCGLDYAIKPKQGKFIIVDLDNKQWYKYLIPDQVKPISSLTGPELDQFWTDLRDMLQETSTQKPLMLTPFDTADWYAWAGAEKPEGSEPLINYDVKVQDFPDDLSIATVIMDATSIDICIYTEEIAVDTENMYELEVPWPAGWAVISQMSEPLTPQMLQQLKFKKVS